MVTRYAVDPDQAFAKAVKRAEDQVSDLRVPLTLISKSWFQSNKFIFDVDGSSGKYADLSEKYKDWKNQHAGFIYPVLKLSGALAKSITDPTDKDAISLILSKTSLILGSQSRTAAFHQFGTKRMPARPPILIGAEQTAPDALNTRRDLWIKTVADYVLQVTKKELEK